MAILRLASGLMLILLESSCATQPQQASNPYITNDFIIALDPPSRGCETKGETTKCTIKFAIPGGTKEYGWWGQVDFRDPGRIFVYLDDNTAVYNQQNVRYRAIDLNDNATKPSGFLGWFRDRTPYLYAREGSADVRLLELYFKHPSDFKPEFLDAKVFWENTITQYSGLSLSSSNDYYGTYYRVDDGFFGFAQLKQVMEDRIFKFKIGTPLGWQPEIANPNNPKEGEGRVFDRLRPER
jgi:hypothetical protein